MTLDRQDHQYGQTCNGMRNVHAWTRPHSEFATLFQSVQHGESLLRQLRRIHVSIWDLIPKHRLRCRIEKLLRQGGIVRVCRKGLSMIMGFNQPPLSRAYGIPRLDTLSLSVGPQKGLVLDDRSLQLSRPASVVHRLGINVTFQWVLAG